MTFSHVRFTSDKPVKWAKTIVAYANGKGGVIFVGVSNSGEAFGIDLDEIDKTKNLIAVINDRHIFPHARIQYMMRSVDENAEHYVLAVRVISADSIVRYREGDFNETVYIKGDGNTPPARFWSVTDTQCTRPEAGTVTIHFERQGRARSLFRSMSRSKRFMWRWSGRSSRRK